VVVGTVLAACSGGGIGGSALPGGLAWVTADASVTLPGSDITPVDLSSHKVEAGVHVGSLPSAMTFTTHGTDLLAVSQGDDTLVEIDPATGGVLHWGGVGVEPDAVAVAPGGTDGKGIALVANLDSNTVTPVDLGTWKAKKPIPVGDEPVAVAVAASSATAGTIFVVDFGSNEVTPIDLARLAPGAPIAVGLSPETAAVAGGEVLVGNFGDHTLTPIGASSLQVGAAIALPVNPTDIVVTASATTAYISGGASVVPLTVAGLVVGAPIALPDVAQGIALGAGDRTAWVALQAGSLVPVDLASGKVGHAIHVGGHPSSVVIAGG
jgi:YVTN family beta-propeller protein